MTAPNADPLHNCRGLMPVPLHDLGDMYGTQTPDIWTQYRGPLDPMSSPSSSASSPRTPRTSPIVIKPLKSGDLTLGIGQSTGISPTLNLSLRHSPLDENNDTSHAGGLQLPLGPSLRRRPHANSGLDYRNVPIVPRPQEYSQLMDSIPQVPLASVNSPHMGFPADQHCPTYDVDDFDFEQYIYFPEPQSGITDPDISTGGPVIPSDSLTFTSGGLSPNSPTIPSLPLTEPHEVQPDWYSQQPPPYDPVEPGGGGDGGGGGSSPDLKRPEPMVDLWAYYFATFKRNHPFLHVCHKHFKRKVGSYKIIEASQKKRKDEGRWVCPADGETFTRKQNLMHHLQSHLGIRVHGCSCGSAFNALSGLNRHKKNCHHVSTVSSKLPTGGGA